MVFANSRAMWGTALGGVARQWLFDNPKVVVLERVARAPYQVWVRDITKVPGPERNARAAPTNAAPKAVTR